MHSKTHRLNQLFDQWESEIPEYYGKFKRDGINDEALFDKAPVKVLFIAKEPNNPDQDAGDYREWWKEGLKYSFSHRIAEWSFGILNGFPVYDVVRENDAELLKALYSIAFMNVKKIGGKGQSDKNEIKSHLDRSIPYIQRQIQIIDPDIVLLGVSWNSIRERLFPDVSWQNSGYRIAIGRQESMKVIDFYHPSARNAPAASYSLLQNVIQSEAFKLL